MEGTRCVWNGDKMCMKWKRIKSGLGLGNEATGYV